MVPERIGQQRLTSSNATWKYPLVIATLACPAAFNFAASPPVPKSFSAHSSPPPHAGDCRR
jgi:hypothetical protein